MYIVQKDKHFHMCTWVDNLIIRILLKYSVSFARVQIYCMIFTISISECQCVLVATFGYTQRWIGRNSYEFAQLVSHRSIADTSIHWSWNDYTMICYILYTLYSIHYIRYMYMYTSHV